MVGNCHAAFLFMRRPAAEITELQSPATPQPPALSAVVVSISTGVDSDHSVQISCPPDLVLAD